MTQFIQPSFSKGEISPTLYGRVDTAAYNVALAKASNCNIHTYGGVSNRQGTSFLGPCKDHSYAPRLIPFQFKTSDQYMLEFGNLYMRVIRNDAYVTDAVKTISNGTATKANPVVITSSSHPFVSTDEVVISGMTEMTELNGNRYNITKINANTFSLQSQADNTNIDGTGFGAVESTGGTVKAIYTIATTYATADLDELKYTQSADTMTLTHSSYPARDLVRTNHNAWTIADVSFVPAIADPTAVTVTVNGADNNIVWKYKVTAIQADTGIESLAGVTAGLTTVNTEKTNPAKVEITGHGLITGDEVEITGLTEHTELNGRRFLITKVDANHFTLNGEDATGHGSVESTGGSNTCYATHDVSGTEAAPTGTTIPDNTITWAAVAGAEKYAVYRAKGGRGLYGLVAETHELTYTDDTTALTTSDTSLSPPVYSDPLSVAGDYPGTSSYFEQRQVYGGSLNKPDTVYYSRTADRTNMSAATPAVSDDAFFTTMASRQVNEIRHFVPLNDLLVLTSGSEWQVNSGPDTAFELASIRQKPQSSWGSSHLRPITIANTVFFVEENLSQVRSFGYSFQLDGYTGTNVTLLANHMLKDNTVVDWAVSLVPEVRFYFCRDDGKVLTLTFDNEQEVIAWTTWTTDGNYERAASLAHAASESQDQVYFIVKRTIDGNTVRYVEKLAYEMTSADPADAFYIDCGLSLDTPHTISGCTAAKPVVVTATGSSLTDGSLVDIEGIIWEPDTDSFFTETQPIQAVGRYKIAEATSNTFELATATNGKDITAITRAADGSITTLADHGLSVGDEVHFHDVGGMVELNGNGHAVKAVTNSKVFTIEQSTSGYTTFTSGGKVYKAIDGSAWNAYKSGGNVRVAVATVTGLGHLEGETLVGNLNGNVIRGMTVSGGAITFPNSRYYSRAHLGLPYVSEIETLDMESPTKETIQGVKVKIPNVTVKFESSRGLVVGPATGRDVASPTLLVEMKQREFERLGEPTRLLTGSRKVQLKSSWKSAGKLLLRQKDPMPMNILAIIPDVEVGDLKDV
jgi:hypothetical protein